MSVVLDASAILALIYREPGHERVTAALPGATASTVNWAEVVTALVRRGHPDPATAAEAIRALGVDISPFTPHQAVRAGLLWATTHPAGLSLGDRACLAAAETSNAETVLTSDRAWAELETTAPIELIR
ncbi:PIN domain nuclease, a component of toxin-antitoxin system (PIN domain) [Pseudonocardia ammonioxydans]|uniref:Ribonuclease VapC n=1 Tax=Pseudonocardia ammonioxydans TaxID=260086 RepID=A0A1I5HM60_PSUAM|nr:type II toxin-antitoxin system VapC family toxin [Pseudonocardia ammonioxydans]SFO49006.1 PIN domain nuclease, a component of toxin-antitoxin system (PIN domain) [Pseudonocardia ammonioxydans]